MVIGIGFLLGITGSLHCLGMCGPIVLALPFQGKTKKEFLQLQYHAGRIISYVLIGGVAGSLGWYVDLSGFHQWLSIILGSLLVFFAILSMLNRSVGQSFASFKKIQSWIRRQLASALGMRHSLRMLWIGMLNGMLPCGLVYVAVSASLYYAHPVQSAFLMLGFGLGTVPSLFILQWIPNFSHSFKGWNLKKYLPYITLVFGIWILFRGLDLNIPLLSPSGDVLNVFEGSSQDCSSM